MRIGDILYFSPNVKFADLGTAGPQLLLEAFRDRVDGYYLRPAMRSIEAGDAFAGGIVCCAAIELIADMLADQQPGDWLAANIPEFAKAETRPFWGYFRDGLIHEGRIRGNEQLSGQFSLQAPRTVEQIGSLLIVNPGLLLKAVAEAFHRNCEHASRRSSGTSMRMYTRGGIRLRMVSRREIVCPRSISSGLS
jgi:hypothetical protein